MGQVGAQGGDRLYAAGGVHRHARDGVRATRPRKDHADLIRTVAADEAAAAAARGVPVPAICIKRTKELSAVSTEKLLEVTEQAREKAKPYTEKAMEAAKEVSEQAKQAAERAGEAAKPYVDKSKEAAQKAYEDALRSARS